MAEEIPFIDEVIAMLNEQAKAEQAMRSMEADEVTRQRMNKVFGEPVEFNREVTSGLVGAELGRQIGQSSRGPVEDIGRAAASKIRRLPFKSERYDAAWNKMGEDIKQAWREHADMEDLVIKANDPDGRIRKLLSNEDIPEMMTNTRERFKSVSSRIDDINPIFMEKIGRVAEITDRKLNKVVEDGSKQLSRFRPLNMKLANSLEGLARTIGRSPRILPIAGTAAGALIGLLLGQDPDEAIDPTGSSVTGDKSPERMAIEEPGSEEFTLERLKRLANGSSVDPTLR
jgi:hypothetical protein